MSLPKTEEAAQGMPVEQRKEGPVTNNPDLTFSDLSDEKYRVYEYPDGSSVRLDHPSNLNVSKSGGHRVLTKDGVSHYIPSGWNHLYWVVKPGQPHFAF